MKELPCSYKDCQNRRIHFTIPDQPRGIQMILVDDDYEGEAYCSFTCAILDGKMSVMKEKNEDN